MKFDFISIFGRVTWLFQIFNVNWNENLNWFVSIYHNKLLFDCSHIKIVILFFFKYLGEVVVSSSVRNTNTVLKCNSYFVIMIIL